MDENANISWKKNPDLNQKLIKTFVKKKNGTGKYEGLHVNVHAIQLQSNTS